MRFEVDEQKKKKLSRAAITQTTGGKVAVGVTIALLVGSFVFPTLIFFFTEGVFDDLGSEVDALFIGSMLFVGFIISFGATWRQRTARVSLRKLEELTLDGTLLRYSFAIDTDMHSMRRNVTQIDLSRNVRVTYDRGKQKLLFEGDIYWWYYGNIQQDRILSIDEMNKTDSYEISNYFIPALDVALGDYIERVI